MAIKVTCPSCNTEYTVDESRAGKKLKCKCGEVFVAPAAGTAAKSPVLPPSATPLSAPPSTLASSSPPPYAAPPPSPPAPPSFSQTPPRNTGNPAQKFVVEKYEPEGGFTLTGIALLVLFTFPTAALLGALASFVSQWFYLVLLFPIGIGFGVGAASYGAIQYGHVRNRQIAGICAFVAGCLAMLVMHYCDYLQFKSTLREQLAQAPPQAAAILEQLPELVATRQQQPPQIQRLIAELEKEPLALDVWLVRSFPSYIDFAAHAGVTIGGVHEIANKKDSGLNLGYIGTYIYWAIEVGIVAVIAFGAAALRASKPYCSQCNAWKNSISLGSVRPPVENAVAALHEGDLNRLGENQPLSSTGALSVSAAVCPSCQENGPIDVKLEQAVTNKKGQVSKKELAHVTYPGQSLVALRALFARSTAPPISTAPPPPLPPIPL